MNQRASAGVAVLVASLALAACGTSSPPATTTTRPPATTTTVAAATRDLVVTPAIRQGLLDADAAYHQLPPSDYTGLIAHETYYAYDPATHLYYAAAGLVPSPSSEPAQVGTQDDGAYNLFTRTSPTAAWRVYDDGLGAAQGSTCPIAIPAAVLTVWNWRPASCYPPQGS